MSIQENDYKLFQNSIQYLHNISTLPQINIPALKSSLCLKRTLMGLRKNIVLPTSATKPKMHCQRCFLNFYDGPATYKIKSKPTQYKFAEKMLTKRKKGLLLTKYQQKYLEKNKKFSGNSLVTICHFCKKETCTELEKPKTEYKPKIIINSNPVSKKKKKNRKKDKLCGLNENVITTMVLNNNNKKKINKKLTRQNLFPNTSNSLSQTTFDDSLVLTPNCSTNVFKNNSLNTIEINKTQKSNKRSLEVITLDSDDSVQEVPSKRKLKMKKKQVEIIEISSTPLITPKAKKKMEKNRNKLSTLIKTPKEKDTPSDFIQLLQVSKSQPSDVINLDSDESVQEVPIATNIGKRKLPQLNYTSTPVISNKKKKNKSNKFSEINNNSGKKNKSSNLCRFLQSL